MFTWCILDVRDDVNCLDQPISITPRLVRKMPNERTFTHLKDIQTDQNTRSETELAMSSDPKKQWEEKLIGKKITEDFGASTVSLSPILLA